MWKRLLCVVFGHRRARLEGCLDPMLSITAPSGLELRVDFCDRCGAVWGQVVEIGIGKVEKVILLSKKVTR